MAIEVVFSRRALSDLKSIGDYIAQDNRTRAASFIADLKRRCQKIAMTPEGAARRDEVHPDIRVVPFGRYLIFYRLTDHVRIVRVLHSARNTRALFGDQA